MGVYDEVTTNYKLPWPEVQDVIWQSKDTPAQYLDHYEIRSDGTLWHEACEIRIEKDAATRLGVVMHRDNKRWEQVASFTGELECHEYIEHDDRPGGIWYSVQFWFRDGVVKDVVCSKWDTDEPSPENPDDTE